MSDLRSLDEKWRMPRAAFNEAALADRIRHARNLRGLDQLAMASACGVTKQAVSKWEGSSGKPNTPSADNLAKVAETLNVRADWLLFGEEPMEDSTALIDFSRLSSRAARCEHWLQQEGLEFSPEDFGKFLVMAYQAHDVDSMLRDLMAVAAFAGGKRRT